MLRQAHRRSARGHRAKMMKSYHMSMGAGMAGLSLRTNETPRAGAGEVLVRVRACSLNYRELSILLLGRYPLPVKPDVIALSDGAGEVVDLGAGVTEFSVGDRVLASIFPHWIDGPFIPGVAAQLGGSLDGMLTEYAALPAQALLPLPAHLSFEEGATLPCAAVTAWNALFGGRALRPGDTVLTLGTGSVSMFAVQLALLAGLRVIATTSSDSKAEKLRHLGVAHVINYRTRPDWSTEVRQATSGAGVQLVVEVGGAGTFAQSLKAVALGGELAFVGTRAEGATWLDPTEIFLAGASIRPVAVGSRAMFAALLNAVAAHKLKPIIAETFDFDRAPAAFDRFVQGECFGKVVIRVNL